MQLTLEQLKLILTKNKEVEKWHAALCEVLPKYDINTPERIASFLAQCGHESGNFTLLQENLNYSAQGLNTTFKKYFPTLESDKPYERKPEMIANKVYANRMGNGDEKSGDGFKHRGRGLIQLTGKDAYTKFAASIGKTLEETIIYTTTLEGAIESACWFWKKNNLNKFADTKDIKGQTKVINGGFNGLDDRLLKFENALKIIK
jgi:putative chitinase